MNQQRNPKNSGFLKKQKESVAENSPVAMQWVKINAATIWVKNRIGQKVVNINQNP